MTIETVAKAAERALGSAMATTAKHVWEKSPEGWKYIISLHGLLCDGTPLIHTKIIFWAKEDKSELSHKSMTYLYDLNCVYRTFEFADEASVEQRVAAIVRNAQFGKQLKQLSAVMVDGLPRLNTELAKNDAGDLRAHSFEYAPTFAIVPCADTVFEFKLNINQEYQVLLKTTYVPNAGTWKLHGYVVNKRTLSVQSEVENADEIPFALAKMVTKMLHKE